MRELILEEQSQARKKQKQKHRYGQFQDSCACDGSCCFQTSFRIKVISFKKKKVEKNIHVYTSKDTSFFSQKAEAVPGYYSCSLHSSTH